MGVQVLVSPEAGTIPHLGRDVATEHLLSILRKEGVLIVDGALPSGARDMLAHELQPWFEKAPCGSGQFFGHRTKRFGGVFAKARSTVALALDPLVLDLANGILRGADVNAPACESIELNLTQAIGIGPGEPQQFLHRDEDLWPFAHDFELMINAMWTLDDFTAENGATRLIRGSHLWSRAREPQPGETVQAIAPAGSLIVWLGGVLHGGGANNSHCVRRGVVFSYRLGWLAPGERLLLSIPPDVARTLPVQLQRLIGYQLHKPNLGWVEGRDPIHWLHGDTEPLAACDDNLTPAQELLLEAVQRDPEAYRGYL
jgi:hypothetical protein